MDSTFTHAGSGLPSPAGTLGDLIDYVTDSRERGLLFLDVLRQRGNQYRSHLAETVPHVLEYKLELVVDGRTLEKPVNYALARVVPPAGTEVDFARRAFVIVDPRAGHGPGIGGFRADSEIGVALRAGHPCYFVGFLPDPIPGQTIEDIARAEAVFLERVIALHPKADGGPCVIGNCQAGWAIMMLAAMRPRLFGPIIVAGSPLSYWQGVHGKFPMRYTGGLLGGSWLTALASDIGCGKFDGAWLVQNFENQDPANTLWSKQYRLYSNIDTEAPRYLKFEKWWGGHVNLNASEIQFIVDELFIGNNLSSGRIESSENTAVDLRNIRTPIVVICSKSDNVTPPQQALGWILDLYDSVDEIRSYGQTIVYTIHETAGHLGIFVSANVAKKEHAQFSSNIDLIDTLPPGLYEAVFERKTSHTSNPQLASGDWIMRCEARTLDDIRSLGGNDSADERRFETVARISKINLVLYRLFLRPIVCSMVSPSTASWLQRLHPLRMQYEFFSDKNPVVAAVGPAANIIRESRHAIRPGNPFVAAQRVASGLIEAGLDLYRDLNAATCEALFLSIYGSPVLQARVGVEPALTRPLRKMPKSAFHQELIEKRISELKSRIAAGGSREAVIRAALYIGITSRQAIDERGFELVRQIRRQTQGLTLAEFKAVVREQFNMLLIDQAAALGALPSMLPSSREERKSALALIERILRAKGDLSPQDSLRFEEIRELFNAHGSSRAPAHLRAVPKLAAHRVTHQRRRRSRNARQSP